MTRFNTRESILLQNIEDCLNRVDILNIISLCEKYEVQSAAATTTIIQMHHHHQPSSESPTATTTSTINHNNDNNHPNPQSSQSSPPPPPPLPHILTILLASYLIIDDLPAASMLCKRITPDIKATNDFMNLHKVFISLYKKQAPDAYPLLDHNMYTPELQPLIQLLGKSIRERAFALITKAYTNIPLSLISRALGLSIEESHLLVTTAGWAIDNNTVANRPPPIISDVKKAGDANGIVGIDGLKRISTVADYVVKLELV